MKDRNNYDAYSKYEERIRMKIKESRSNDNSRLNKEEYGAEIVPINEHTIQSIKDRLQEKDEC